MNEFFESDQEWMTLEDYCLERDLLLNQTQLISEGTPGPPRHFFLSF